MIMAGFTLMVDPAFSISSPILLEYREPSVRLIPLYGVFIK
jgi:hypothetical protein